MSTRAIKKITKKDDLKQLEEIQKKISTNKNVEESDTNSDDDDIATNKTIQNNFNLLNLDEIDDNNSENEDKEDDSEFANINTNLKKKSKKKKKKTKNVSNEANEISKDTSFKFISSIDDEENLDVNENVEINNTKEIFLNTRNLLQIESKHLNYDNEMIRMFGAKIVQNERNAASNQRGGARRGNFNFTRQNAIVNKKPTWPPYAKVGLSMKIINNDDSASAKTETASNKASNKPSDNLVEFAFEHSNSYQNLQHAFMNAVESLDHNNILAIIHLCPYHIDSLIQMSEISRIHDDSQMAADLIERALFAIQNSFHPSFHFINKSSNQQQATFNILNYNRVENRCLFIALFKHILNISSKACYRTSLELCKLLLSLDIEGDPLAIILLIDLFALRSSQYNYLIEFYEVFNKYKHLNLMPNMSMSVALAHFYLFKQTNKSSHLDEANKMLKEAFIKFPSLLMELLDKCGIQPDKQVEKSRIFAKTSNLNVPQGLKNLIDLYAIRMHYEWKIPENLQWLEQTVKDMVNNEKSFESKVNENKKKFKSLFNKVPSNVYRHLILSDYKEIPVNLPPDYPSSATYVFDPVPPKNSIISYTRPVRQPNTASADSTPADTLFSFFQSLLPSYNQQEQARRNVPVPEGRRRAGRAAAVEDDEAAAIAMAAADGTGNGDRFDVRQMVNRLRDFFNQIQDNFPIGPPLENNQNNNNDEEDDADNDRINDNIDDLD